MRLDTLGLKNDMRKIDKMIYDKQSREKICDAARRAVKRHVAQIVTSADTLYYPRTRREEEK